MKSSTEAWEGMGCPGTHRPKCMARESNRKCDKGQPDPWARGRSLGSLPSMTGSRGWVSAVGGTVTCRGHLLSRIFITHSGQFSGNLPWEGSTITGKGNQGSRKRIQLPKADKLFKLQREKNWTEKRDQIGKGTASPPTSTYLPATGL